MNALVAIARLEFTAAARLKWIRLLTAAFALMAAAAAYSAGAAADMSGADGFARTTMALVPVALVLVPLAALVLGVTGQTSEPGGEPFLFAQPIGRATVLIGRWAGESAALAGAITVGFGIGAAMIATNAGVDGLLRYAVFVAASIALAMIFLSLAAAVAAMCDKRAMALGAGTFVWFFFVLLYDGAALSAAGWLTGRLGGRVLFLSVFGNPADIVRVAMLSLAGTPNVLGAAGDAWTRFLGGPIAAASVSAAALAAWTIAPIAAGAAALARRDL